MRTVAVGGGLGDVLIWMHRHDAYNSLNRDPEPTRVILFVHNLFAHELFEWMPCRKMLDIRVYPFEDIGTDNLLVKYGYDPKEVYNGPEPKDKPVMYISPCDEPFLMNAMREKYVVIQPGASDEGRIIPAWVSVPMRKDLNAKGFRVYCAAPGMGLSAPGMVELVKGASLFIGGYSAMLMAAWLNHVPNILMYNEAMKSHVEQDQYHNFGMDYPETRRGTFEEFNPSWITDLTNVAQRAIILP